MLTNFHEQENWKFFILLAVCPSRCKCEEKKSAAARRAMKKRRAVAR
jgi:hypothetical protein